MDKQGQVQTIIFRNVQNGYSVLSFKDAEGGSFTANGIMPLLRVGEQVVLHGEEQVHPKYGKQFVVSSYECLAPSNLDAIYAYLSSGVVRGIGEATAKLIVDAFGMDTLRILDEAPERLMELPGIGSKKYMMIRDSYTENKKMRDILLALEPYGVTVSQAVKVFQTYGDMCMLRIQEDPYRLIRDIDGIGFLTADRIAQNVSGFETDSFARLRAGIIYALNSTAAEYGHTYLPMDKLISKSQQLLDVSILQLEDALSALLENRELATAQIEGEDGVFLPYLAHDEALIARKLLQLTEKSDAQQFWDLEQYQHDLNLQLTDEQERAVSAALDEGVIIITGGPGTGKTTIIRVIVHAMLDAGLEIALAAPTGRAAKRMTETTGFEASTLHRLLEYAPGSGFGKNADDPLFYDLIVIDEMSMVDVPLMAAFLSAVPRGTRIVLVGVSDQLPSVGCGDVLRDCIRSARIPVFSLTEVFRQEKRSMIITNAHRINRGQMPILEDEFSDFRFESLPTAEDIRKRIAEMFILWSDQWRNRSKLFRIQVLSPMKKGPLGVLEMNAFLQKLMNPDDVDKAEHISGSTIYREGDKVMQIRNNYKQEWTRILPTGGMQDGVGVFNGDLGIIHRISRTDQSLEVLFDGDRSSTYSFSQLDELELAYCISIHKSQGSELPVVLLPLAGGPPMLLTRNLLYTAVTRAKKQLYILGREDTVARMVNTDQKRRRYTSLCTRLLAYAEGDDDE